MADNDDDKSKEITINPAPTPHVNGAGRHVRKRDGVTTQPFTLDKIEAAIRGAWCEVGGCDEARLHAIAEHAAASLPPGIVEIEEIQNCVEVALMRNKLFDVAKSFIIYRNRRAELRAQRRQPDPEAVSGYIHAGKYARYLPEPKRREVYDETIDRDEGMHLRKFGHIPGLAEKIKWAFGLVRQKRLLPSMRSMQFGGAAIERTHNRIYNCSATHLDRLEAFSQGFFLLLCGCGVGYSVQFEHIDKLPEFAFVDRKKVRHHVVEDSIEGWADAGRALLQSYVDGVHVEFAFHLIRDEGVLLKTAGGKAPGHLPLKRALERIRAILDAAQGRRLRPIEAHRIMCHFADAVLAGGIRRSAMIALFSLDDSEMMNAKIGNWFTVEPWFKNANNSCVIKREGTKKSQFKRIFQMTKQWGDPGFIFCVDGDDLFNPCAEIGLNGKLRIDYEVLLLLKERALRGKPMPQVKRGETYSGFAFCVAGDTKIITRAGIVEISEAVGKEIEVWNGVAWRPATPFVTGSDRTLYRVHFGDGSYLDCTANHKFLVADRFMNDYIEVETQDLLTTSKYTLHVPRADVVYDDGLSIEQSYEYGFFLGDGHVDRQAGGRFKYLKAALYGTKVDLPLRGSRGPLHTDEEKRQQAIVFDLPLGPCEELKTYDTLPEWIFSWNASSIRSFVAGWADADGSRANDGIRIYGSEGRIRMLQLLLTKVGINASVNLMDEKGAPTNFGERQVAMWYAQIPDARGLPCHRLDTTQGHPATGKGMHQTIRKVEELPGTHTTYCLEESERHTCLFNNVITKQCNLVEINASKLTSLADFLEVAHAATLIGTLQAAYTDMPYLGWVSEVIAEREALLGVGMTGMMDAPDVALNPDYQRRVAEAVVDWNAEYAALIGIRPAARLTCVKPSGTTSLELGCVGSGIHPHHARRYFRRVTANELEPVFLHFRSINPHMCVRKPDGDWVIEFPVEAPEGAILKEHLGAIEFLEKVKSTQLNWVVPGTARPESSPGYSHNVSNTVTVRPGEWDAVAEYLWENREHFTGVTLLSATGDKDQEFVPFESVVTEADEARWNQLLAKYKPVDYRAAFEDEDHTNFAQEAACPGGACDVVRT